MDDYTAARRNMVESQVRPNEVTDSRLVRAMLEVPREQFVPVALRPLAYMENEVVVGQGGALHNERRLLAPMPQARLIQLAEIAPGDLVLDIGCATGYSTAVLARMAESVVGLESDAALADSASQTLTELEIDNAAVVTGPLKEGYAAEGPFDAIVINGCVPEVPEALLKQLKDGGRLVVLISDDDFGQATLFRKSGGRISHRREFDAGAPPLPGFEKEKTFVF